MKYGEKYDVTKLKADSNNYLLPKYNLRSLSSTYRIDYVGESHVARESEMPRKRLTTAHPVYFLRRPDFFAAEVWRGASLNEGTVSEPTSVFSLVLRPDYNDDLVAHRYR